MDRSELTRSYLLVILLVAFAVATPQASAQQMSASQKQGAANQFRPPFQNGKFRGGSQRVYNPVTKQTEPRLSGNSTASHEESMSFATVVNSAPVASSNSNTENQISAVCYDQATCSVEPSCDVACGSICEPGCDFAGDCILDGCSTTINHGPRGAKFYFAFEATMLQPYFADNVAFTTTESDGATFNTITDSEFSYDTVFSPRLYLGWTHCDGVGLRITWWDFDEDADPLTTSPPANGFGSINHPAFGAVDISSTIPTDVFTASTSLSAHTLDIEGTKETQFRGWKFGVSGGFRYAELEQTYLAQLSDNAATLLGEIDYQQSIEAFGPTVSIKASRPLLGRIDYFCKARGSLLYGDGETRLAAGEDLDLSTAFTTTQTTTTEDLLSIGELQIGLEWQGVRRNSVARPFASVAMEGQTWSGIGNATGGESSIGFFGVNASVGYDW